MTERQISSEAIHRYLGDDGLLGLSGSCACHAMNHVDRMWIIARLASHEGKFV